MTMSVNKALRMICTSHVSFALLQNTRANEDPAAFLKDPGHVWTLGLSLEEYITQFCESSCRVPFDEVY